jgi:hypothetical protein
MFLLLSELASIINCQCHTTIALVETVPAELCQLRMLILKRIGDQAVLHGVVMNIVNVALQIRAVSNNVIPKPILPDASRRKMMTRSEQARELQLEVLHGC